MTTAIEATPVTFEEGQAVWWHRTEGGGGGAGHRPNAKTPIPATFLRYGRGIKAQILVGPDYGRPHPIWVWTCSLTPRG